MAVQQNRVSRSRRGKRRSHHARKPINIQYCPECNEAIRPHRVCTNCGHYQGREIVAMGDKQEK